MPAAIDLRRLFFLDDDCDDADDNVTIHDIDTCVRKPLVVTVGSDRTLRAYDYETSGDDRDGGRRRPRRVLSKTFPEDARSVSLHPTGMHALVAFPDTIRLVHVLSDDVRTFREVSLKGCRTARFGRGGQWFAAAHGSVISLYDFYRGAKLRDLWGHNAKVCRVLWSRKGGDASLLSSDEDGNLYKWDVETGRRSAECALGGNGVGGAATFDAVSKDAAWVAAHGRLEETSMRDLTQLKIVDDGGGEEEDDRRGRMSFPGPVASSHEESSMVFVGTTSSSSTSSANGTANAVRIYSVLHGDFVDFGADTIGEPISLLHVSHDDRRLFIAGNSGRVAVYEVNDRRGAKQVLITARRESRSSSRGNDDPASVGWCRNVLVSENSIEEREAEASDLRGRIDEIHTDRDYRLRARDASHAEQVKKAKEDFRRKAGMEQLRIRQVEAEIRETVEEFEERVRKLHADNEKELARVEAATREELLAEVEQYQKGSEDWKAQQKDFVEQKERLIQTHVRCRDELERELLKNLKEKTTLREDLERQVEDLKKTLEETRRQLEEDVDAGIEMLKERYEAKLAEERDTVLKYAGENGILHKKTAAALKDIEDHKEMVKMKLREREDTTDNMIELEGEIKKLQMAVRAKEDVVVAKDADIRRLKKKQEELKKFRYVLGDRIKNYAGQMKPRDDQAKDLKEQIAKTNETLDHYRAENEGLEGRAAELSLHIDQLQKKVTANMKRMNSQDAYCKRLLGGLDDCTQLIQKPDELVQRVKTMCAQINSDGAASGEEEEEERKSESHAELIRRRDDLLNQLTLLKEKQTKTAAMAQREKDKARKGNEDLLEKINGLRESNKKERAVLRKQQEQIQNALLSRQDEV